MSRLRRLGIDLRPGEGTACGLLFAFHFLLLAFQYTVKSVRQGAFVDAVGAENLPLAYLAVALCTYPVLVLYRRAAARHSVAVLLSASAVIAALSLGAFGIWFEAAPGSPWPSVAFYLWTSVVGVLLVSQFWSFAGLRLDPRQARRLFATVGAGGILGSVAGGQIARFSSGWAPGGGASPLGALLVAGALLAALVVCLRATVHRLPAVDGERQRPRRAPSAASGAEVARRSRYLRRLSAGMLLAALVSQIVDLQFAWMVEHHTESLAERTAAFGNLYSVMGVAAFFFQILITARIHRHLGMGFALRVLPAANGVGSAVFLGAALFAPAFVPAAIWALKIAENGLRYSLEQATRELLFLPIPEARRAQAKAFVDVFVQRAAKGIAALVLLSVTFGGLPVPHTAWIALAAVAVWLWVVEQTRRLYVATFRRGLLDRVPDRSWTETLDRRDVGTLEVLVAGLGSLDPRQVCHSLELLKDQGRSHLVPPVILAHEHEDVRLRALDLFRTDRRGAARPWAERLLSDPSPAIRAAAIRTLAAITPKDLCDTMRDRLGDPDPRVRSVAGAYLADQEDPDLRARGDDSLVAMVDDPSPAVRREAAHALGELDEPRHQTALVQLLYDPDLEVARGALRAVEQRFRRGGVSPLYGPIVVSLLRRRKLKHEARAALVAYGEPVIPALQHFLFDPGEDIWVRRALPKTLAAIGGPRALDALTDALAGRDGFQRLKVVEALGALRASGERPDPSIVEGQLQVECRLYLRTRLDLWSLEDRRRRPEPRLLERLLHDRLRRGLDLIFGLLGLLHRPREMRAAHRGILRRRPESRIHALEYLDNVLVGEVRARVFAVIDDLPRAERTRLAHRLYGLEPPAVEHVLEQAVRRSPGDADAPWLTAAALWFLHEERIQPLYFLVRRTAERDPDPVVQETAGLILRRIEADR